VAEKLGPERFLRGVLIVNGIGDIALAALMIFLPGPLSRFLGFGLTDDFVYVAGGWGTAAFSFGAMRFLAGWKARGNICWYVGAFGIVEGLALAIFCLSIPAFTTLALRHVWMSALFAAAFAMAYGVAFLKRRASAAGP